MKLVVFFIVCASVSEGLKFSPFGLYEDIVVEISESVPRQKCQRALDNLEVRIILKIFKIKGKKLVLNGQN